MSRPKLAKSEATQLADVPGLPVVLRPPGAARLADVSVWTVYESIARGDWPSPVVRVGKSIRIPTAPLLAALGLSTEDAAERLGGPDAA